MNDLDPRVRVRTRAELTDAQYKAFTDALGVAGLDGVVEVTTTEIRLPKEEKPLVTVPEDLKGHLGEMTLPEYVARLTELSKDKSFINRTWNALMRYRFVKVYVEGSDGSDVISQLPEVSYKWRDSQGSEHEYFRSPSLSDRKQKRSPGGLTSEQVAQAGHFIDFNELAHYLEEDTWKRSAHGVGIGVAGTWAVLVNEDIQRLEQLEPQAIPE